MVDNQNSTLDLDVIKFRAEILTKYGKELTIFHKEGNGWNYLMQFGCFTNGQRL